MPRVTIAALALLLAAVFGLARAQPSETVKSLLKKQPAETPAAS